MNKTKTTTLPQALFKGSFYTGIFCATKPRHILTLLYLAHIDLKVEGVHLDLVALLEKLGHPVHHDIPVEDDDDDDENDYDDDVPVEVVVGTAGLAENGHSVLPCT